MLIPGERDLTIVQGDYFEDPQTLAVGDVPVDLTDWTGAAQIRDTALRTGTLLGEFDVTITDAVNGELLVSMEAADTALLTITTDGEQIGYWDLQLTDDDGKPRTYLRGTVSVLGDRTL